LNHQLYKISDLNRYTENLFKDAAGSAGMEKNPPQVLITITARFQRLSWKYESMAYNVILKNVGVLYQTMYLVATAMELSPCALGGGDSDLFAKTAGLNYYEETSVGEFLLGSKRV
jgi:SagB-type dehydrogenase family enzyme